MRIKIAKLTAPNKYIKTRGTIREKSSLDGGWIKQQRTSANNVIAKYQIIAKIRNLRNGRGPQGGRLQNEMPNTVNQGTNKTQITTQPVECGKTCLYKNACPIAPMSNPQLVMLNVPIMQRRLTSRAQARGVKTREPRSGTERTIPRWLQRFVRRHHTFLFSLLYAMAITSPVTENASSAALHTKTNASWPP